jgi:hypothetical protein
MGYIKEIWAKPHILGKLTKRLGKRSKKWGVYKKNSGQNCIREPILARGAVTGYFFC